MCGTNQALVLACSQVSQLHLKRKFKSSEQSASPPERACCLQQSLHIAYRFGPWRAPASLAQGLGKSESHVRDFFKPARSQALKFFRAAAATATATASPLTPTPALAPSTPTTLTTTTTTTTTTVFIPIAAGCSAYRFS